MGFDGSETTGAKEGEGTPSNNNDGRPGPGGRGLSLPVPAVRLNIPSVLTKELRLQRNATSGERWVRLSSNLLDGFGFGPNSRLTRSLAVHGQGFTLAADPRGATKVYQRVYNQRRNRPCETVIDLKVQSFLDQALLPWTEAVHFTIKPGIIVARPQAPRAFHISRKLKAAPSPFDAFFAMSSGIDQSCFARLGFNPRYLVEWRPNERRDSSDLTETGILTSLANNAPEVVFNENIYTLDMGRVRAELADRPPVGLMHLGLQCDDHSCVKRSMHKELHVADLSTTVDMVYPALRLIEEGQPGVVVVENVPNFAKSGACELLTLTLRRWGYNVSTAVLNAPDFGGHTTRTRFYLIASIWPGFEFPTPTGPAKQTAYEAIAHTLASSRDVTDLKTTRDGVSSSRIVFVTPEAACAPTTMKSQSHQPKDGTYIKAPNGRILWPTEEALRILNGIPADFDLNAVAEGIAVEQIGQGIEFPLHHAVGAAVYRHVRQMTNAESMTTVRVIGAAAPAACRQGEFSL